MKNYILSFVMLCFAVSTCLVFQSCTKKGDNDPWISFRTRKQRLTGEWKLVSLSSFDQLEQSTSTSFNQLFPCDTASEAGIVTSLSTTEQTAGSTTGYGEIQNEIGSEGSVKTFAIGNFSYNLNIDGNGTYTVTGTYSYANEVGGESIEGSFSSVNNTWHWVDGDRNKDGISFVNFPVLDVKAAEESGGRPISYSQTLVMDMDRLSKEELQLSLQTREDAQTDVNSDAYFVPSSQDSLAQCIKTVSMKEVMRYRLSLAFQKKTENDTL